MFDLIQVHPKDGLAQNAVARVLNLHHGKRIKQSNLNFYRRDYDKFLNYKKIGGEVIMIVAMKNCAPVGLSCCSVSRVTGNASRSITVVDKRFRRHGIGKLLLSAKIGLLRWQYSGTHLTTFVAKDNDSAIRICEENKLHLVSEQTKQGEDGKEYTFFEYSTRRPDDTGSTQRGD